MARDKKSPGKIDRLLRRVHGRRGGRRGSVRRRRPAQAHEEAHGRTDPGSRSYRPSRVREACARRQEPRQLTQRQDHQDTQGRLTGRDPPGSRGHLRSKADPTPRSLPRTAACHLTPTRPATLWSTPPPMARTPHDGDNRAVKPKGVDGDGIQLTDTDAPRQYSKIVVSQ